MRESNKSSKAFTSMQQPNQKNYNYYDTMRKDDLGTQENIPNHIAFSTSKKNGQTVLSSIHEGTRSKIVSKVFHQGSQRWHQTKSLGTNINITSDKNRTSTPIRMIMQTKEIHKDRTNFQTKGTYQRPQQRTRISLEVLWDFLTWCNLVHYKNGTSTFHHQRMDYKTGGIHPTLYSGQHQVWHVHGLYPRFQNQEQNQENVSTQATQESTWTDERI